MSHNIQVTTRTIHTIAVSLSDDDLSTLDPDDTVEVVLTSRNGGTRTKRLTYGDVRELLGEGRNRGNVKDW
jgi:hypothetical protein